MYFELQRFLMDDGAINYGLLMRYWRKYVMRWKSAQILADVYNEILQEDEPLTVRAIQRMEQQNKVPTDQKRRWLLATILNIPPAYFGLHTLAPYTLAADDVQVSSFHSTGIDVPAYMRRLQQLWLSLRSYKLEEVLVELLTKIQTLQEALLYGNSKQRNQSALLLCHYLILYGNIRRDQGYSDSAISFLNKAIKVANEKEYYDLEAKAYYLKGYAHFDKWGIQPDRLTDRQHLQEATVSFQSALHRTVDHEKKNDSNAPLKSAIIAELGLAQAYHAQSSQEKIASLRTIDTAGKLIRSGGFQHDPLFLYVDDEWYHIDKAEAYVALQWGQNAVEELDNVDRSNPHTRRRYIYTDIIEADAYLTKNQIEMAVACAENALDLLEDSPSFIFVSRISHMYHVLRQDKKYMTSPDVARLGGKLLKIQHSYLFK